MLGPARGGGAFPVGDLAAREPDPSEVLQPWNTAEGSVTSPSSRSGGSQGSNAVAIFRPLAGGASARTGPPSPQGTAPARQPPAYEHHARDSAGEASARVWKNVHAQFGWYNPSIITTSPHVPGRTTGWGISLTHLNRGNPHRLRTERGGSEHVSKRAPIPRTAPGRGGRTLNEHSLTMHPTSEDRGGSRHSISAWRRQSSSRAVTTCSGPSRSYRLR